MTSNENVFYYRGGEVFDKTVRKVVVVAGVKKIDDKAFIDCKELQIVVFEGSHQLTEIGDYAFLRCMKLQNVVFEEPHHQVTEIGSHAFYGCKSLRRIDILNGVTKIGEYAFKETGLEEIAIPDGIEVIPDGTFIACKSLRSVELPPSVKEIGSCAFRMCPSLEKFVIPKGLPALKKLNLSDCSSGVHGWTWMSHLLANSPNLEELSLREVWMQRSTESTSSEMLQDDDIPMILQLVALCPSLRSLDISWNKVTPKVFEKLESQDIPDHLRRLRIRKEDLHGYNRYHFDGYSYEEQLELKRQRQLDDCRPFMIARYIGQPGSEYWRETLPATSLLRVLDANPKLGIWTPKFWHDAEDQKVRHRLEMNRYGCRGFTVPNFLWPLLIQRLAAIDKENTIRTGAPNVHFHLLQRHPDVLGRIHLPAVVGSRTKRASHEQESDQKKQKTNLPGR